MIAVEEAEREINAAGLLARDRAGEGLQYGIDRVFVAVLVIAEIQPACACAEHAERFVVLGPARADHVVARREATVRVPAGQRRSAPRASREQRDRDRVVFRCDALAAREHRIVEMWRNEQGTKRRCATEIGH